MFHYTLNTGHTMDTRSKPFDLEALAFFDPAINKIRSGEKSVIFDLLDGCKTKITIDSGFALFDIFKINLISSNAVCWDKNTEQAGWEAFRGLFLDLEKNYKNLKITSLPVKPGSIPWLATITMPNIETIEAAEWLADCEQCLAKALIANFTKLRSV